MGIIWIRGIVACVVIPWWVVHFVMIPQHVLIARMGIIWILLPAWHAPV
jgi:hypothetical protein